LINTSADLPDEVDLSEKEIVSNWQLWLMWRALDKKFLPSELLKQDFRQLTILLTLDNLLEIMIEQDNDQETI